MIDRAAIAGALGGVDGLTASESRPDVVAAGSAWPEWVSTRWVNMQPQGAREVRWRAYVALPNATPGGTIDAGDPLIEAAGQALTDLGLRVDLVESWAAATSDGSASLPALRYSLTE